MAPRPRDLRAGAIAGLLLTALGLVAACGDEPVLINSTQVDVFRQEIRTTVDVLLVVDNSCSMIDEQNKLARNFDAFIEQFLDASVDYQIGVVTTDMLDPDESGRLVGETKVIDSGMDIDLARDTFSTNVKVCATGSGYERGLAAAKAALSEPLVSTDNAGFLRDDAALSIVFVSDEDDGSAVPTGEYLDFFQSLKGDDGYRDPNLVNLSAVVGPPPDGCEQPAPVLPDCTDGLDEADGDGLIDCEDPDCASDWKCSIAQPESDCDDGVDNDNDGVADCADADCGSQPFCRELDCADGADNDGDGLTDCHDVDCLVDARAQCGELSCEDGDLPHHGPDPFINLLADCNDPSCFTDPAYEEICLPQRAEIDYRERCDLTVVLDEFQGVVSQTDGPDVDDPDDLGGELAGCADPDCASFWLCQSGLVIEPEGACGDCQDNDNDGAEDCDDLDCADSEYCDNPYPIEPGHRYIDAATRSGGIVTSICAEEFSGLVRELGLTISGLRNDFFLTAWPRLGTLRVYEGAVEDANELTGGWVYEAAGNRIVFSDDNIPIDGSEIRAVYERSTTPPTEQEAQP